MKKFAAKLIFAIILGLGAAACSDNSTAPVDNPNSLAPGTMNATVNDVQFNSQQARAVRVGSQITVSGARLTSYFQSAESITLVITDAGRDSAVAYGYYSYIPDNTNPTDVMVWNSAKADVVITSITPTEIQGRFSFVGQKINNLGDKKTIKNGVFRVKITD